MRDFTEEYQQALKFRGEVYGLLSTPATISQADFQEFRKLPIKKQKQEVAKTRMEAQELLNSNVDLAVRYIAQYIWDPGVPFDAGVVCYRAQSKGIDISPQVLSAEFRKRKLIL